MRHPFEPLPMPPEPDDWHRDAACRDTSTPDDWFPDQPGARSPAGARAMNVCRECPVQQQCAAAGAGERYGIWGGLTEARRKRQRQARNRATPPHIRHGTHAGSGTTAEACIHEHMQCIAIEREADYLSLIVARLSKPMEIGFDFGAPTAKEAQ